MVGLQARGEPPAETYGGARPGNHANLGCDRDQVEVRAELGDRGGALARNPASGGGDLFAARAVVEQPFAKLANGLILVARKLAPVDALVDNARDLIAFVAHDRMIEQIINREVREHQLRGDALALAARGQIGEFVTRTRLVGTCQHLAHRIKAVRGAEQAGRELHRRLEMENPYRADQTFAPFEQFKHMRRIVDIEIRVTQILDRRAIA